MTILPALLAALALLGVPEDDDALLVHRVDRAYVIVSVGELSARGHASSVAGEFHPWPENFRLGIRFELRQERSISFYGKWLFRSASKLRPYCGVGASVIDVRGEPTRLGPDMLAGTELSLGKAPVHLDAHAFGRADSSPSHARGDAWFELGAFVGFGVRFDVRRLRTPGSAVRDSSSHRSHDSRVRGLTVARDPVPLQPGDRSAGELVEEGAAPDRTTRSVLSRMG